MYTITVLGVTEQIRVAVLRETGSVPGPFTVTIDKNHPLWNAAVDLLGTNLNHRIATYEHTFTERPTPENVLEFLKGKAAQEKAKEEAERAAYEADVQRVLSAPAMDLLRSYGSSGQPATEHNKWRVWIDGSHHVDGKYVRVESDERLKPRIAELKAMVEEQNKRYDAAQAAKEQAELDVMSEWAKEHGSNRLKRSLAEGIKCKSLYMEERIAKELPGWTYYSDVSGKTTDPINATDEDFALLDEARAMLPESVLKWYSGEDGKGMVVEGKFLGVAVIYGHDSIESEDEDCDE